MTANSSGKIIIVSTRLPVSVTKVNGKLEFNPSSGGLATAMSRVSESRDSLWIGWPGINNDELTEKDRTLIVKELKKYKCHPVFLSKDEVDNYYSGYCNATIWPLFHYFNNMAIYSSEYWESYKSVNELFAQETGKFIYQNSTIWVHDYQLMLLPALLRSSYPDASIGFFLHIPFPSYEIFRLLPERTEILQGLLGADLIGFHTYDYVRHFLSSVKRHLGYESHLGAVNVGAHKVKTDAFPIGIDYDKFSAKTGRIKIKELAKSLERPKKQKVILSIDRADYSKGIPARLDSYRKFLSDHPESRGKVTMIQLAVPSRGDVNAYQELREKIEQKVSRINGEFSTVDWTPVIYMHKSLPFDEVQALYSQADIMLVTPFRDGMNLVAKEYLAARHKQIGVLILSEMAGAASELQEAIQVNPNDYKMISNAINSAINMPVKEQKARMKSMQDRIKNYDVFRWAEDFIIQLENSKMSTKTATKQLNSNSQRKLIKSYGSANKRLLLLDYDGTLKSFVNSPKKSLAYPSPRVRRVVKKLTDNKKNQVMVISGRPKSTISEYFENKGLGLVAEHGGWVFEAGSWVKRSLKPKKWKKPIKEVLVQYAERTPGALVEEKDFSLVWHYRNVHPELAYVRNAELQMNLQNLLNQYDVEIFEGAKILEIKPPNMHKGVIASEVLSQDKWDFILCIGDDYTDEDMFKVMPDDAYTIHVGSQETKAKYRVDSVKSVISLLENLSNI